MIGKLKRARVARGEGEDSIVSEELMQRIEGMRERCCALSGEELAEAIKDMSRLFAQEVKQLTEVDVEEHPKSREKFSIVSRGEAISYVKFKKVPEIVPNVKRIKLVAPDAETGEKWCYRLKKSAIMSLFISPDVSEVPDLNDESEEVPYESGAESPVTSAMNSEDFGIENEDSGSSVLVPYNEDDNEYVSPSAFGPSPLAEGLSE